MTEQVDVSMPAVPAAAMLPAAGQAPVAEAAASPVLLQPLAAAERRQLRRALAGAPPRGRRAGDLLSRFLLTEVVNGVLEATSLDALLLRLVALAVRTLEAERGTVFLHDPETDELWARVAIGGETAEIRTPRTEGVAGAVFESGRAQIVADAYADARFNAAVDARTGYRTRSLIGVPVTHRGKVIAVIEILNKRHGAFDVADAALLQAIAAQAAIAIDRALHVEEQRREQSRDRRLLELSQGIAGELRFDRLLESIVEAAPRVLDAERATLFLRDPATDELCSRLTAGGGGETIRLPRGVGLAGACFATRRAVNVAEACGDPRFYAGIDRRTGFRTRSVLCMPIIDQAGSVAGVLEVLNKRRGHFTAADERRLRSFARQVASALQNAQLLADVLSLKSDGDSVLRAMSDGVVTLDGDFNIRKVNDAARRILGIAAGDWLEGSALKLWGEANPWLREALAYVATTGGSDFRSEVAFTSGGVAVATVNATVARVRGADAGGYSLVLQDITRQKKAQAVVSRYMARQFAERVLESEDDAAARATHVATILFSDIRRFTALTEKLKAAAAVDLLNEYFGEMAEIVSQAGGAVDKYLGDGLLAVFGSPAGLAAEADDAVGAATLMVRRLAERNRRHACGEARKLAIGIGLASGEIVTGPIGSKGRTDFTVIGDSVNLAARLESANKYYGTTILVAGGTVARLSRQPLLRPIDVIRAVGKETPTEIFELLEHHSEESFPGLATLLPLFEAGIRQYRARDWARALGHFAEVLRIAPRDGPSWVYTDRCLYYRDHPPPDHWDGVWTMQTK